MSISANIEFNRRGCRLGGHLLSTVAALAALAFATAASAEPPFAPGRFDDQAKGEFRASIAKRNQDRLVDTGARLALLDGDPLEQVSGVTLLYVQFQGRLDKAEQRALANSGVNLIRRAGRNTWLAQVTPSGALALSESPEFRGSAKVEPEDKITDRLYARKGINHAINADGDLDVMVKFLPHVSIDAARTTLLIAGADVEDADDFLFGRYLNATMSAEQIAQLASNPAVLSIREIPGPVKDHNANSAAYSNTDVLLDDPMYALDGSSVTIGMWESGNPRDTHQELTGRISREEGSVTDHGTHVGGTILASGVDPTARGMAPAAGTLHSYTSGGSVPTEMVNAVSDYAIVLSNNSWGAILGWDDGSDTGNAGQFGNYTGDSSDWDDIVLATGLVISKSAGNDRNDCNPADATDCDGVMGSDGQFYDNMGPRSMAKNIIAVGAVDSATGPPNDITGFSSAGPADDGRIKPDIVADGGSLRSSCFNSDTDYCNKGGTSMAAPSVTGSTAVLFQHYRDHYGGADPSVEIVKALLVNSADERGRPGPDYLYGHGMLNALAAAQIIDEGEIRIISDAVDQDEVDEFRMLIPAGMDELRVTMTWLDPPGEESDTDHVFHDLDLELEDPSGGIHYPWMGPGTGNVTGNATRSGPNTVDNVEDAEVTNPEPGVWLARVIGTDTGLLPQNYALVANQDFSLPDQPEIEVNFSGNIVGACTDQQIERIIRIFNTGGADLFVNSVTVDTISGGFFEILDIPAQPVIIAPGSHVDYTLRYTPQDPTDDSANLVITSNDVDEEEIILPITGMVGEGNLAATMEALGDFGDVMAGMTKVLNLDVINEGTCDGIIEDVFRLSGDTDFTVGELGPGLSFPITLAAGASLHVPINFAPTPPPWGPYSATIRMEELNYVGDPVATIHDIPVVGESSEPEITVSGAGDFGQVCGGDVAEREFSICNTGELNTLHIFLAKVVQPGNTDDCDDFEIVGNPFDGGADISHDFCVPLTVRYTPTEAGSHMCRLWILSNDPDEADLFLDLTGETPLNSLAALADLTFDPTVIQEIGPGQSRLPLPVVNNGMCPVTVTAISDDSDHYDVSGEPVLPYVNLQPGEQLGDGALEMLFQPVTLARELTGVVTVEYEEDPITAATNSVSANMCGEGVWTGARVLVTRDGLPVEMVESIQLLRKVGNTNGKGKNGKTDSVDVSMDLPLQSVVGAGAACPSFDFHKEYGTVDSQVQLLPGDYELTVTIPNASGKGKKAKMTQAFSVEVTDFVHTIVVDF